MRVNYPPVDGYESDVGSKTTFDMVNMKNIQRIAREYRHVRNSSLYTLMSGVDLDLKFDKTFRGFYQKYVPGRDKDDVWTRDLLFGFDERRRHAVGGVTRAKLDRGACCRFPNRLVLLEHPTFLNETHGMYKKVKEAIQLRNETSLFARPNTGVHAVVFMTQVPPASPVNLCYSHPYDWILKIDIAAY